MNPMIVVLFAMEFVSLMLAVVLATAWKSFGRPRHALIWCAAFAVAAVGWAVNMLRVTAGPDWGVLRSAVHVLEMLTWALILLGFRERAGLVTRVRAALPALGLPVAALVIAALGRHNGLLDAIPPLFAAVMLACSAGTMIRRDTRHDEEPVVIAMLLAFAILDALAGFIALRHGGGETQLLAALMVLTAPSAFIGTGLFAVFLLAADLGERMGRLAARDPLTGVLNRRGFEDAADRAVANARRQGQPLTIVMVDLDRFKSVNDRYGHAVGDRVLCRFVEHVTGSIRAGDLLGRIGGEEFAMLLVDAAPSDAMDAVDRIRVRLGQLEIPVGGAAIRITASFGMTGPIAPEETLATMLARADEALYSSKIAGRDKVTLAAVPPTVPVDLMRLVAAADVALGGEAAVADDALRAAPACNRQCSPRTRPDPRC